jgi:hypothetical protein
VENELFYAVMLLPIHLQCLPLQVDESRPQATPNWIQMDKRVGTSYKSAPIQ